ncbi:MAG: virulence RhuM family protein [Lachnospiraceae bacterium]|nr:virulence RhuM family protein [Lachnospiraceae bacterium]
MTRERSVIGKHVRNIFKEGELNKDSVWAKFAYTATDGKTYNVDYYNLDVIISVGYRVKSHRGTQFPIWAMGILKEYMKKGYATSIDYDPRAEYDKYKNRLEDILSSVKTDFIESINSLESIASKK